MSAQMIMLAALLGLVVSAVQAADKPLTVFILAGQSNMEGHAQIRTFAQIGKAFAEVMMTMQKK